MTTALTPEQIKQRLRYQGKQYSAGGFARGGSPEERHYLEQAADLIEALEAELAAVKLDAERMDKLAELMFAADFDYGEDGLSVLVFQWPKNVPVGADLRRNVDAAMAAQEKT